MTTAIRCRSGLLAKVSARFLYWQRGLREIAAHCQPRPPPRAPVPTRGVVRNPALDVVTSAPRVLAVFCEIPAQEWLLLQQSMAAFLPCWRRGGVVPGGCPLSHPGMARARSSERFLRHLRLVGERITSRRPACKRSRRPLGSTRPEASAFLGSLHANALVTGAPTRYHRCMSDHQKVVVYLRAGDVRLLKERGVENVAAWVRSQVKAAVALERQLPEVISTDISGIRDS